MTSGSTPPRLLIVAGPNGSGKTTLTTRLREFGLDFGEYVNADEVALTLPKSPDRDRLAQIEADNRRRRLLDSRESFSFETVMSHPSKIDEMREAKALGFHFTFYFVAVDNPQINLKRVQQRVAMGGHDVPPDRVLARYERTMALMPKAILLADQSFIFDNSSIVEGPRLVAQFQWTDDILCLVRLNDQTFKSGTIGLSSLRFFAGLGGVPIWVRANVIEGVRMESQRQGIPTNLPEQ